MSVTADQMKTPAIDVVRIREDFPNLAVKVHGKPLVYLDNAATTQKPRQVLDKLQHVYAEVNANVHRGVHQLSQLATDEFEAAREKVRAFINAASHKECVFVRGTTEAINLVSQSFLRPRIKAGDEILISYMEHHANIVPWQMLCEQTGAVLKVVPMHTDGSLDMKAYEAMLNEKTRLVSIVHVSNVLGTVNPVKDIVAKARSMGVPVLLDGAQAVAHCKVDVQDLGCDFYAFSGHKICGPTGIGVLYGREELLEEMPPWQGGGEMIARVSFTETIYSELPIKFEAGTPHIAGAIGLGEALDYLSGIGLENIAAWEHELLQYANQRVAEIEGFRTIGTAENKASVLSFVVDGVHPHDLGTIIDHYGVAVRTGHHCAMPIAQFYDIPGTARASFAFYNTMEEVDAFVEAAKKAIEMFS